MFDNSSGVNFENLNLRPQQKNVVPGHLVNNIKQFKCVCLCAFGSPRAFSIFVVAFEQKSLETTGVSYCIKRITRPQRDTTEAERERPNATIAWQLLIAFKSPTLSIDVSCVLSNLIFTFYECYTTFVLFYRFFSPAISQ